MANVTYTIGFKGDVKDLRNSISEITKDLEKLSSKTNSLPSLQQANMAAKELAYTLKSSTDWSTGKLDLTSFNNQLKLSGKDLSYYQKQLTSLGVEGQRAFLNVATQISSAEIPLARTNTLVNNLWTTLKNTARWQVSNKVLNSIVGTFQHAYSYAQQLDKSLNNIQIVTGNSTENMRKFATYANQAAQSLSTTTTKYTDASLIYFQQGLDEQAVKARTETTVKLSNVSGQSAEEAAEQLTAIWNNFDKGSKSLEYYADVITALGASTASSSQQIAKGMQQFAAVAETTGLSYEYAASMLATIVAATKQSEDTVGTGLRTILSRLESVNLGETLDDGVTLTKYTKALEAAGIQVLDMNGQLKKADELVDAIGQKWQTLTDTQKTALAQTVGGKLFLCFPLKTKFL